MRYVREKGRKARDGAATHPANDVLMIRQVRLAVLTPINLVAVQVGVVRETHLDRRRIYFIALLWLLPLLFLFLFLFVVPILAPILALIPIANAPPGIRADARMIRPGEELSLCLFSFVWFPSSRILGFLFGFDIRR